jgi:meso-butanediol dehydrogenase/(S,S)-butanediol dehydrogenase/diacetyl reductase
VGKGAVLISGAAGAIGSATVDRFLASGYEVVGIDLDPEVETLRADRYRGKVADVTKPEQLATAVEEAAGDFELRHLVGLAGGLLPAETDVLRERDPAAAAATFGASLSLNLSGQFSLVHASLPRLERAQGDRSIVLCSSVNALRGYGAPAYSAAKAGLIGMMHALATPLGRLGIRVNVVAPGTTRTRRFEEDMIRAGAPDGIDKQAQETPLGRVAEPVDVAAVIESLADRLPHVTDEVIRVDGGHLLARPPDGRRPDGWRRRVGRRLHNRPFR